MKIGIIGAGMVGAAAGRVFAAAGHDVAVSNSRGAASLAAVVAAIGPGVRALSVDEAARFGEVVLLAVPWRKPEALPAPEAVAGRIVIDAMNPYAEGGGLEDLRGSTSSEHTRRRLPEARLVKAFNTIYYKHLAANGRRQGPLDERHVIFVAGDDEDAKAVVKGLIDDIGFAPVDTGSLVEGGAKQQPGTPLYNRPMTVREAQAYLK
jgi:predicted dinucleotide-binding enzyme